MGGAIYNAIYRCFTINATTGDSLPSSGRRHPGRAVGAGGGGGNCKTKKKRAPAQSRTATGPCRSFSKKQFRESGSSSLERSPPPSWCDRFDWALPSSDHSSCQRRFRERRLRSNSSFALAYVARTRTLVRRSHFRLNHFCQAPFIIFSSSCVLTVKDTQPAVSTTD